jgi:hypothetical protein
VHTGFGRLHRIMLIMDGRGGAGQVVDLIGLKIERKRYIVPDDFKTTMIEHALDVTTGSSKIIIDANDIGALLEQTFAEVGTEKSGSSGDQHARLEVQRQSPLGWAQLPSTPKQVSPICQHSFTGSWQSVNLLLHSSAALSVHT